MYITNSIGMRVKLFNTIKKIAECEIKWLKIDGTLERTGVNDLESKIVS